MAESITIESVTETVRVVGDPLLAEATREPCVRLVLDMTSAEAEALASAPRTASGDLYADAAREVAEPIADALVAAGYGAP
jgi:hypothetical protein